MFGRHLVQVTAEHSWLRPLHLAMRLRTTSTMSQFILMPLHLNEPTIRCPSHGPHFHVMGGGCPLCPFASHHPVMSAVLPSAACDVGMSEPLELDSSPIAPFCLLMRISIQASVCEKAFTLACAKKHSRIVQQFSLLVHLFRR